MKLKICLWILMVLILINGALALGIRPAKTELNFEPGVEKEVHFSIINNEKTPLSIRLSAEGMLKDFVYFEKEEYNFTADEEIKEISFKVRLPSEITPGDNTGKIIVTQVLLAEEGEGVSFFANLKLEHKLTLNAPYPEKYIDVDIKFNQWPDKVDIVTEITNKGSKKIGVLQTQTEVYDGDKKIKTFVDESLDLETNDRKQFYSSVDKEFVKNGTYKILSSVKYDEKELELTKVMTVGEPKVEIINLDTFFSEKKVNEFKIEFKNQWNEKISGIYADLGLSRDGSQLYDKKTVSFDLEANQQKVIRDFIDGNNIEKGPAKLGVTLHYAGKEEQKEYDVRFLEEKEYEVALKEQSSNWLLYLILAMVVIIFISMVFLFVFVFKKKKPENPNLLNASPPTA